VKKYHIENNDQHQQAFKPGAVQEFYPVIGVKKSKQVINNICEEKNIEDKKTFFQFFQIVVKTISIYQYSDRGNGKKNTGNPQYCISSRFAVIQELIKIFQEHLQKA
jgi:hypothetical protein